MNRQSKNYPLNFNYIRHSQPTNYSNYPNNYEKDLRISYLDNNNCLRDDDDRYEYSRQQSKYILKDITDKYGFSWDNNGRLTKNCYNEPEIVKNKRNNQKYDLQEKYMYEERRQFYPQPPYNYHRSRNQQFDESNKRYMKVKEKKYAAPENEIEIEKENIKSEIEHINLKIDYIFSKYRDSFPHSIKGEGREKQRQKWQRERQRELQRQRQRSPYKQCKCERKNRLITENIEVQGTPHFGLNSLPFETLTRSKSVNNLVKTNAFRIEERNGFQYNRQQLVQQTRQKKRERDERIQKRQHHETELGRNKSCMKLGVKKPQADNIEKTRQIQNEKTSIDTRIEQITLKIKESQKEKEKLDINFKRFQIVERPKTPEKISFNDTRKSFNQTKKSFNLNGLNKNKESPRVINKKIQSFFTNTNTNLYSKISKESESSMIDYQFKQQTKYKPQGNEYESKLSPVRALSKTANDFVSKIYRQIDLDQEFRNAKLWFESNEDPHKWGILADKLSFNGVQMKYHELVSKFSCCDEQRNPFFSQINVRQSYASLLSVFMCCQKHWKDEIQNQFDMQDLIGQDFTQNQLDVEQKGFVRVQDFVRFLNMKTKTCYRSRDLLIIFQRLAGKDKREVAFQRILQILLQ